MASRNRRRALAIAVGGIGRLGAYTTFSSFAHDTIALARAGRTVHAFGYVIASCGLGVAAAALGLVIAGR